MLDSRIDHAPVSPRFALTIAAALALATIPIAGLAAGPAPVAAADVSVEQPLSATRSTPDEAPVQQDASAATSLSGTVLDGAGRTVPDVAVDVVRIDAPGGPKPRVRTGADGRFEMRGLPPGEYEVASSKPGFKKHVLRASLKPAVPAAVKVVLELGSLSETVTVRIGPASSPAPGAVGKKVTADAPRTDPCDNSPVGGCVTPPVKLVDIKPIYPPALAAKKTEAEVVVRATLQKDGLLGDFRPEAGPDSAFVEAALGAIRQWKFTPAKLNGVPQECQVMVTIRFVAG